MQSATKCETLVSKPDENKKRRTVAVTTSESMVLTGLVIRMVLSLIDKLK